MNRWRLLFLLRALSVRPLFVHCGAMFPGNGQAQAHEAAYAATESHPGGIAGGLTMEQTDEAADELARSEANDQAGRGDSVVAATEASRLADWKIKEGGNGRFTVTLPET